MMEPFHRTLLRKNRMAFAEDLVLDEVVQLLVEEYILNDRMVEVINSKPSTFDRNVAFLNKLPSRGPRAFYLFYTSLLKTGQEHLAKILHPALPRGERNELFLSENSSCSPTCDPSSFSFAESTPSKNSANSFNSAFDDSPITQVTPNQLSYQSSTPKIIKSTPIGNILNQSPPSANVPCEKDVARMPVEQMDVTALETNPHSNSSLKRMADFVDFEALRSNSSLQSLQSAAGLIPSNSTANTSNHIQVMSTDNHMPQETYCDLPTVEPEFPNLTCDAPSWEQVQVRPTTIQFLQTHMQNSYPLFNSPKGIALLVNVTKFEPSACLDDRIGGDVDCARLELMFHQLTFDVYKLLNGTANEISNTLKNFAVWAKLKQYDSCFIVMMSHGEEGVVFGSDGHRVILKDMFNLFSNENCPHLQNKPKVFLIQACRGEQPDKGTDEIDAPVSGFVDSRVRGRKHLNFDKSDSKSRLPTNCDCIYAYATVPGFTAMRNTQKGSWFIQAFIKSVAFHARDKSLIEILTITNNQIKGREGWSPDTEFHRCKEMSEFTSTFCKPFYFFPGICLKRASV